MYLFRPKKVIILNATIQNMYQNSQFSKNIPVKADSFL